MNESTRIQLREDALAIDKFRALHPNEQEWLRPLLSRRVQNILNMLDLISDSRMTFEEIALALGCNPTTVSQRLNALLQGGAAINLTETSACAPTGRPRTLARR